MISGEGEGSLQRMRASSSMDDLYMAFLLECFRVFGLRLLACDGVLRHCLEVSSGFRLCTSILYASMI